jgi:hypothetical protein
MICIRFYDSEKSWKRPEGDGIWEIFPAVA